MFVINVSFSGAGFYIDATSPKYSKYYNMFTHVFSEIPDVLEKQNLPLVSLFLSRKFALKTFKNNRTIGF